MKTVSSTAMQYLSGKAFSWFFSACSFHLMWTSHVLVLVPLDLSVAKWLLSCECWLHSLSFRNACKIFLNYHESQISVPPKERSLRESRWLMGCDLSQMGSKFHNKNLSAAGKCLWTETNRLELVHKLILDHSTFIFFPEWNEQYDWVALLRTIEQDWQMHYAPDHGIPIGPSRVHASRPRRCSCCYTPRSSRP